MIDVGPGTDIAPGTVFFSEFYRLGSLSFGGTSSLAISNGPILGSGAFTVEYWIKHGASVTLPTILLIFLNKMLNMNLMRGRVCSKYFETTCLK